MERRIFLRTTATGLIATPLLVTTASAKKQKDYRKRPFKNSLKGTEWEGKETTSPDIQHPYFPDKAWEKTIPNYLEYNRMREDTGATRSNEMIAKHEPHLKLAGNRSDAMVDFVNTLKHPHVHNHWWSWVEIWDGKAPPTVVHVNAPAENETLYGQDGVNFFAWLYTQKPLENDIVRVRAYCVTHGLFTKYEKIA